MFSRVVSNIRKRTKKSKDKDKLKLPASKSSPSFRVRATSSKKGNFDGATSDWYTTNDEESETDTENIAQSKSMTIISMKCKPKLNPTPNSPPSHPTSLPLNRKFCDDLVNNDSNSSSIASAIAGTNPSSSINLCSLNFSFVDDEDTDDADDEGAMASSSYDFKTMKLNKKPNLTTQKAQEVLCGNRVSQMTRTYDDIQAVTRLLEEKEKDLELTVQIGKELLTQNNRLESRVTDLESELKTATENLAQLSHELHQKNELISILTNDVDDSGSENVTPTASKSINLDLLQRKISTLEIENKSLRLEVAQVVKETDEVEEQERKLMEDITQQLNSTNVEFDGLNLELERQKEENRLQHEQIVNLSNRLSEAEIRLHQLTNENEEASSLLTVTKENQGLLAAELAEFKARYQEVLNLLHETQEQLRIQRKRSQPAVRSSLFPGIQSTTINPDSLQSELMEISLFSDHSLDSGIVSDNGGQGSASKPIPGYKKVFETVRYASNAASKSNTPLDGQSQLGSMAMSSSYQPRMSSFVLQGSSPNTQTNSTYKNGGASYYSTIYGANSSLGGKSQSRESLTSESDDNMYPSKAQPGMPGCPGAKDLEAALKRLTPAEVLARRAMLSHAPLGSYTYEDEKSGLPLGLRTPDSIMSTGTGSSGLSGLSSQWRLPEKLQIVKPMEGSQTLHHWSRLATPTLSGLLEERPGVTIRGGRNLDELGLQVYSLSDLEEDADELPGKQFETSGCVYTYTNSTVLHPDDGTSITFSIPPSQVSTRMHSECSSRQPSCPPTPRASLSRRNSCSTFSVHMGLASMLNERGIKAVTPSALNTPSGQNYSPTVTPCNSPEGGTPNRSTSPEPQTLATLLTSGADLLRKKFSGMEHTGTEQNNQRPSRLTAKNKALTHLERRALRQIRIMDKVESLGLENIIPSSTSSSISPLALHGTSAFIRRTASPMTQLTSLKHLNEGRNKNKSDDSMSGTSSLSTTSSIMPDNTDSASSDISSSSATTNQQIAASQRLQRRAASEARIKQMQRQRSRRNMMNGASAAQRPDLGTVQNSSSRPTSGIRPDLGAVSKNTSSSSKTPDQKPEERSLGFVGTISSLLFGRKGGLL